MLRATLPGRARLGLPSCYLGIPKQRLKYLLSANLLEDSRDSPSVTIYTYILRIHSESIPVYRSDGQRIRGYPSLDDGPTPS